MNRAFAPQTIKTYLLMIMSLTLLPVLWAEKIDIEATIPCAPASIRQRLEDIGTTAILQINPAHLREWEDQEAMFKSVVQLLKKNPSPNDISSANALLDQMASTIDAENPFQMQVLLLRFELIQRDTSKAVEKAKMFISMVDEIEKSTGGRPSGVVAKFLGPHMLSKAKMLQEVTAEQNEKIVGFLQKWSGSSELYIRLVASQALALYSVEKNHGDLDRAASAFKEYFRLRQLYAPPEATPPKRIILCAYNHFYRAHRPDLARFLTSDLDIQAIQDQKCERLLKEIREHANKILEESALSVTRPAE